MPDSLYENKPENLTWKALNLLLDECCVQFNVEPEWGLIVLDEKELLKRNDSKGIAQFINGTTRLHWHQVRNFLTLQKNTDVLEHLTTMMIFKDQFLPTSLRKFFAMFHVPVLGDRTRMDSVLTIFSREFSAQNESVTFDGVSIIAYALVLLSVDQFALAGQIRNKMSKREFIKNTLRALENADASCEKFTSEVGDYYDNVYLVVCGYDSAGRAELWQQKVRLWFGRPKGGECCLSGHGSAGRIVNCELLRSWFGRDKGDASGKTKALKIVNLRKTIIPLLEITSCSE